MRLKSFVMKFSPSVIIFCLVSHSLLTYPRAEIAGEVDCKDVITEVEIKKCEDKVADAILAKCKLGINASAQKAFGDSKSRLAGAAATLQNSGKGTSLVAAECLIMNNCRENYCKDMFSNFSKKCDQKIGEIQAKYDSASPDKKPGYSSQLKKLKAAKKKNEDNRETADIFIAGDQKICKTGADEVAKVQKSLSTTGTDSPNNAPGANGSTEKPTPGAAERSNPSGAPEADVTGIKTASEGGGAKSTESAGDYSENGPSASKSTATGGKADPALLQQESKKGGLGSKIGNIAPVALGAGATVLGLKMLTKKPKPVDEQIEGCGSWATINVEACRADIANRVCTKEVGLKGDAGGKNSKSVIARHQKDNRTFCRAWAEDYACSNTISLGYTTYVEPTPDAVYVPTTSLVHSTGECVPESVSEQKNRESKEGKRKPKTNFAKRFCPKDAGAFVATHPICTDLYNEYFLKKTGDKCPSGLYGKISNNEALGSKTSGVAITEVKKCQMCTGNEDCRKDDPICVELLKDPNVCFNHLNPGLNTSTLPTNSGILAPADVKIQAPRDPAGRR